MTITRRTFVKATAAIGAAAALSPEMTSLKWLVKAQAAGPEEKVIGTACVLCHGGCGLLCHVKDGKLVKVEGDPDDPVSRGATCVRPQAAIQYVYSPFRLKYPMERVGARGEGKWQRLSWDEAIDRIAKKLLELREKYGPETLARFSGTGRVAARYYPYLPAVFGSPNNATFYICYLPKCNIQSLMCGTYKFHPEPYNKSKCLVLWGQAGISSNPDSSPRPCGLHYADAVEGGTKIIIVDPQFTREASKATLWLPLRPGKDTPLALSWLNVIIGEKLYDREFVEKWTNAPFLWRSDTQVLLRESDVAQGGDRRNFVVWDTTTDSAKIWNSTQLAYESETVVPALEGTYTVTLADGAKAECKTVWTLLSEHVKEWTPEKASEQCWVPADKIREAARMFATNKPSCMYTGVSHEQSGNATSNIHAVLLLAFITGGFDVPGGILSMPPGLEPRVYPMFLPRLPTEFVKKKEIGYGEVLQADPDLAGTEWNPSTPDYLIHKAVTTGKPYTPHAYYVIGGNPFNMCPEAKLTFQAFKSVEFSFAQIIERGPVTEICDIVLPVPTPFERNEVEGGMGTPGKQRALVAVIPAMWESRSDYGILRDLVEKMGMGGPWSQWADDLDLAKWEIEPYMKWEEYSKKAQPVPISYKRYEKGLLRIGRPPMNDGKPGFKTPSGKVELYMSVYDGRPKDYTHSPLPTYKALAESYEDTPELAKEYPLILVTGGRELNFPYFHSMYHHIPWQREIQPSPMARINPETAAKYGIGENDWVWVETQWGKARYQAELYEGVDPRVVAVSHAWYYPEMASDPENPCGVLEANANALLSYSGEGTGREEFYHDIFGNNDLKGGFLCKVYKCAEGPPEGSGIDRLVHMYKTGEGITW